MIEISADHIADLTDDNLRSLIGLLCEAELRSKGLPISAVTWGGHQDASDGGVDVRVALPIGTAVCGFVPRPATGFQVKAQDMPRNAIFAEMRPRGTVRPAIRELAEQSGAYVIVSSRGSTSDSALQSRRTAMADAVTDLSNVGALRLDFYDRTRIATWVRARPGLIPWVRQKIGKAIPGWQGYGAWAYPPEGLTGEYLLDDTARLQTGRKEDGAGLPVLDGIKRIRDLLREPAKVVRLVGLSGVGKTRLVQALFDARVGEGSLDPSLALYTNMADGPDPQPTGLVSDLAAGRTRSVVVVDNCPSDLHRRLSEVCRLPESTVSVITIEYDIREDEPDGTEVFTVKPSSLDLVAKLIGFHFPEVSAIDARTVAEFSGGNARIAIALATTIGKNETITGLTDENLFLRLFQQRHEHDKSLLLAAEACSLVYSFNGEEISGDEAELPRIGALIGENAQHIFRSIAELRRRDLIQQRGVWRAVLPPAIANRLAARALQDIPYAVIRAQLVNSAPARLLTSFTRRLGYLHDSADAVVIVKLWLGPDGLLGNFTALNELDNTMFINIAPVAPDATLAALERAFDKPEDIEAVRDRKGLAGLLRSLAYDAPLFDRCVALLIRMAEATGDSADKDAESAFGSLFSIYLSGTLALVEQRLRVAGELLRSPDPAKQSLGLKALAAMLEAWHFFSGHTFEFGARSRDYGYWPRTDADVKHWYTSALGLVEVLACSEMPVAGQVRRVLAQKFRALWNGAGVCELLDRLSRSIAEKHHWTEGWIAVRETLQYDHLGFPQKITSQLSSLEQFLRPKDLVQKVRSIVLTDRGYDLDLVEFDYTTKLDVHRAFERRGEMAYAFGKAVAAQRDALNELLPELLSGRGSLWAFGEGLAAGSPDPNGLWNELVVELSLTPERERNVQVLRGFVQALRGINRSLSESLLDEAVQHDTLAPWLPELQTAIPIDETGVARLKRSLALGKTPVGAFRYLGISRSSDPISGAELRELLLLIAARADGVEVAIEILSMSLHSDNDKRRSHDPEVIRASRELLEQFPLRGRRGRDEYQLGLVLQTSLTGPGGADFARSICRRLKTAISKGETYGFEHGDLVRGLFKAQPAPMLDELFAVKDPERQLGVRMIQDIAGIHGNPIDLVPHTVLLGWCKQQPGTRYPVLASVATPFSPSNEWQPVQWTAIGRSLLEEAPDRVVVLDRLVQRLRPTSWSGSIAAIMEARIELLQDLETHTDSNVAKYAQRERCRLRQQIEKERRWETKMHKAADERFE